MLRMSAGDCLGKRVGNGSENQGAPVPSLVEHFNSCQAAAIGQEHISLLHLDRLIFEAWPRKVGSCGSEPVLMDFSMFSHSLMVVSVL